MILIDLNALLLELKKMESEDYASEFEEDNIMGLGVMMAIRKVKDATTIEAEPVRHARWIKEYDFEENYSIHKCSNCGGEPYYESDIEKEYHYCPYCGAKMDKKSPENHKKYQEEETNKKAFK